MIMIPLYETFNIVTQSKKRETQNKFVLYCSAHRL